MADSLPNRLFQFWTAMEPGVGNSMQQMLDALSVHYPNPRPQAVRSALTALRKGGVIDPSKQERYLPRLFVWHYKPTKLYYDFGRMSPDTVQDQIPGITLENIFRGLLTRAGNLNSTMGQNGVARSRHFLSDDQFREMVNQIPIETIEQVAGVLAEAVQAKVALLGQQNIQQLPGGTPGGSP